MTDTDLITAGGSTESGELPNTVTADISLPRSQRARRESCTGRLCGPAGAASLIAVAR